MYPPTRVWGMGLRGGMKAQPVPQPQLNPWIYPRVSPTRGNPYPWLWVHVSTGTGASCQKKLQGYLQQSLWVIRGFPDISMSYHLIIKALSV